MQQYTTVASRNLIRAERQMLKHADTIMVLGRTGTQKEHPKNETDTLVFRRLVPYGASQLANPANGLSGTPVISAAAHVLQEGTNPAPDTMSYVDVSVTLQNYGCLYKFSSKVKHLYEDDIPADMQRLVAQRMAEVVELVRYGAYKAGTAVVYTNGSSRSAVNTVISLNKLRAAVRGLENNRAMRVTTVLDSSPNYGTSSIEAGYIAYVHPDAVADIRNLPGFTKVADYGRRKVVDSHEIGSVEDFRFISSPLFAPFLDAGGSPGSTIKSNGGSAADVYPMIVCAEDAWGSVALKGMGAIQPTMIPVDQKNHANPLGMFGYVGATTWFAAVRLNENWMVRIEHAVTAL